MQETITRMTEKVVEKKEVLLYLLDAKVYGHAFCIAKNVAMEDWLVGEINARIENLVSRGEIREAKIFLFEVCKAVQSRRNEFMETFSECVAKHVKPKASF